jgi:hypothetical protein
MIPSLVGFIKKEPSGSSEKFKTGSTTRMTWLSAQRDYFTQ